MCLSTFDRPASIRAMWRRQLDLAEPGALHVRVSTGPV